MTLEELKSTTTAGYNIDEKDSKGFTMFHKCCEKGDLKMVEFVIEELHADPEVRDPDGLCGLHWASMKGHLSVVKYLLEKVGVPLFNTCYSGHTALQLATANCQIETMHYLMNKATFRRLAIERSGESELSSEEKSRELFADLALGIQDVSSETLYLLPVITFLQEGRIASYMELKTNNALVKAANLGSGDRVLFVVHQWEGRREPDPGKNQFKMIRKFLVDWAQSSPSEEINYLWVDFSCLVQERTGTKVREQEFRSQIPNILSAAYISTYFLVVPRVTTVSENPCTDLRGLFNRGWCQIEITLALLLGSKIFCCYWFGRMQTDVCVQKIVQIENTAHTIKGTNETITGFKAASMRIIDSHTGNQTLRQIVSDIWTSFTEPPVNFKNIVNALISLRTQHTVEFERLAALSLAYSYIKSDLSLHEIYWDLGEFRVPEDRLIAFNLLMVAFIHLTSMVEGDGANHPVAVSCHCLGGPVDCKLM